MSQEKKRVNRGVSLLFQGPERGGIPGPAHRGRALTVDPSHTERLKDGHEQETHATGCVIVKELEDVHASLDERSETENLILRRQTHPPTLQPLHPWERPEKQKEELGCLQAVNTSGI